MIFFHVTLLQLLTFVVSVLLPLVVALVTKNLTKSKWQAIILLALSFVTSIISTWISALQSFTAFDFGQAAITFGTVFVIGVAAHYGLWKPTGVTAALLAIGSPKLVKNGSPRNYGK